MNPTRAKALLPGAEMDAQIALHVMKWQKVAFSPYSPACQGDDASHAHWWGIKPAGGQSDVPPYTTDIRHAMEVLERIKCLEPHMSYNDETGDWMVSFDKGPLDYFGHAKTLMMAICEAALSTQSPTHPEAR